MKRSRYIIIFILVLAIIIVAGVLYRNKTVQNPPPPPTTGGLPTAHLPSTQNGGGTSGQNGASSSSTLTGATSTQFGLVADIPALNYYVDANNTVFIVQPEGPVTQITNNAQTVISSTTIPYLRKASFSYDGRWILREYGVAGQKPAFSLFDIQNRKELLIPAAMENPAWAPDSERIVFFTDNGTARGLATLNLSDKNPKAKLLMNLAMQDTLLSWVRPDAILLTEHPSVQAQGSAYLLTVSTKNIQTIISERYGATVLWDPAHPYGLLFTSTLRGVGGELYLAGEPSTSQNLWLLPFLTFPSKCTFSIPSQLPASSRSSSSTTASSTKNSTSTPHLASSTVPALTSPLYCLIPSDRSILDTSPLPDLYEQRGLFTSDNAFRVNLETGETVMLYKATLPLDGIRVTVVNNRLFFVNRFDNRLYALTLPYSAQ